MTNTLTWDIKPIQLPKVNANLLSALSLFIMCLMFFTMIHPVLAFHCGPEEKALDAALVALGSATAAYVVALLTAGFVGVAIAAGFHLAATMAVDACQAALDRCNNDGRHNPASGGCDSGGCG